MNFYLNALKKAPLSPFREYFSLSLLFTFLCFFGYVNAQQTVVIFSGDNNTTANNKIRNAFNDSNINRLEIRNRTLAINVTLNADEQKLDHDLIIIGSNSRPATFPNNSRGAHTFGNNRTILNFRNPLTVEAGCTNFTIQNLRWNNSWIACEARHRPFLNFTNVIFDVTRPVNRRYFGKRILQFDNGFRGNIINTSFLGFGFNAIIMDRTSSNYNPATGANEPISSIGFFNIERCLFQADPRVFTEPGFTQGGTLVSSAISVDAGNDEFALPMDFRGSVIRANRFEDSRIAISKGTNININRNTFVNNLARRDILHLEEFSSNIDVRNNTFISNGPALFGDRHEVITLGALQGATGVTITDNRFLQNNNRMNSVINGGGLNNITISGNTLNNAFGNLDYITFFRCGNSQINITQNNASNLGTARQRVDGECAINNFPIDARNDYLIRYRQGAINLYLRANDNGTATLVARDIAPTGNAFKWRLNFGGIAATAWNRYYIQNVKNNRYLEVPFGPTAPEQNGNIGERYKRNNQFYANLACRRNYPNSTRPGFMLIRNGNNYAIVPGGNEVRSHLRRIGNSASVGTYISREVFTIDSNGLQGNWRFDAVSGSKDLVEDVSEANTKTFKVYPSPATDIITIAKEVSSWSIYNLQGEEVKNGSSKEVEVSDLSSGFYIIQSSNGEIAKFMKK